MANIDDFKKLELRVGQIKEVQDHPYADRLAILRGVESQGMLLAAADDRGISIISPEKEVKLGSMVK